MQKQTKHLAVLLLMLVGIFISAALILATTGCTKDEDTTTPTIKESRIVQEVVWDGMSLDLFGSRTGITPNFVFHPGSWTTDSYFLNILRQYRIYNHGAIDSIKYERVNPNFANAGFLISNYDITIHYKNGFSDLLENYLCPISYGDNFTQYVCPYPINKIGISDLHVTVFERTLNVENRELPYRGFQLVKLWIWNTKAIFNGTAIDKGNTVKEPETSKTTQYQPRHVI